MKKTECERAIRPLCHVWRRQAGLTDAPPLSLHCTDFVAWLRDHHPTYLDFRSRAGAAYDIELWFDQEFRISWAR